MSNINDFVIENGLLIEYVGSNADVVIPDCVTSIGDSVFEYCESIVSVTIPNSVTSIGSFAFNGCPNLKTVIMPDSITCFGCFGFEYIHFIGKQLDEITFHKKRDALFGFLNNKGFDFESEQIVNSYAHYVKLQKKNLYPYIPTNTVLFQFMLKHKVIPVADLDIVYNTVKNHPDLLTMFLDYKNEHFSDEDIQRQLNKNPLSVSEMKKVWGFKNKGKDELIIISYKGSDKLITIPESIGKKKVTGIGNGAFRFRNDLTNISIPDSVTSIGDSAFESSGITSILIPGSVTNIGCDAFSGCTDLTSIVIEESNEYYDSRNNCNAIIETNSNTLIQGCKNTIIPNSITSIGDGAFRFFGITSIIIPDSITSIGRDVFRYCEDLTSITIPNKVTHISDYMFADSGLTNISIPNSIISIGEGAFWGCGSLKSISIPNSVTSIGRGALGSFFDNITICCQAGSFAEKYAKENNKTFVIE